MEAPSCATGCSARDCRRQSWRRWCCSSVRFYRGTLGLLRGSSGRRSRSFVRPTILDFRGGRSPSAAIPVGRLCFAAIGTSAPGMVPAHQNIGPRSPPSTCSASSKTRSGSTLIPPTIERTPPTRETTRRPRRRGKPERYPCPESHRDSDIPGAPLPASEAQGTFWLHLPLRPPFRCTASWRHTRIQPTRTLPPPLSSVRPTTLEFSGGASPARCNSGLGSYPAGLLGDRKELARYLVLRFLEPAQSRMQPSRRSNERKRQRQIEAALRTRAPLALRLNIPAQRRQDYKSGS